jgi:hypothetical protein
MVQKQFACLKLVDIPVLVIGDKSDIMNVIDQALQATIGKVKSVIIDKEGVRKGVRRVWAEVWQYG